MAMTRAIKRELLEELEPLIYSPLPSSRKRRIKEELNSEPHGIKAETMPIKRVFKQAVKKKSKVKPDTEDVEITAFSSAKRRPYQWKGRQVKKVLRPGVPIIFSPGQKQHLKGFKRSSDEMYGDEDILFQEKHGSGGGR